MNAQIKTAKALSLCMIASIAVVLMCMFCPAKAMADEVVAHSLDSNGNRTDYTSVDAAINDGYLNKTIIMDRDWELSNTLGIADSKSVTIDMNGHKIKNNNTSTVIRLYEHATLTLKSTTKSDFSYQGYSEDNGSACEESLTSGGLVTGGKGNDSNPGGIWMENWTTLTLDNAAVAGNYGDNKGGGMRIDKECKLNMKNGASVQHNYAYDGGGIFSNRADSHIEMNNSFVSANYAKSSGGGIYGDEDGLRIKLENNSGINNNKASQNNGGGAHLRGDYSTISSDDKTGTIKNNKGYFGGGLSFRWCGKDDGIYGCTLTGNEAEATGGGVYLKRGDLLRANLFTIENCTITNNSGNGGGGVYAHGMVDVMLKGKDFIKDNTRGEDGSRDDLFLGDYVDPWVWWIHAYIQGGADEGSQVGIRAAFDGNKRIGKNITNYHDVYFMDKDNYYITHGNDEGGDLWQRSR